MEPSRCKAFLAAAEGVGASPGRNFVPAAPSSAKSRRAAYRAGKFLGGGKAQKKRGQGIFGGEKIAA